MSAKQIWRGFPHEVMGLLHLVLFKQQQNDHLFECHWKLTEWADLPSLCFMIIGVRWLFQAHWTNIVLFYFYWFGNKSLWNQIAAKISTAITWGPVCVRRCARQWGSWEERYRPCEHSWPQQNEEHNQTSPGYFRPTTLSSLLKVPHLKWIINQNNFSIGNLKWQIASNLM